MKQALRYLVTVQYDYRDTTQAAQARILLPLYSILAGLALVYSLTLDDASLTLMVALGTIVWLGVALWLLQRGYLNVSAAMVAVLLWTTAAAGLLLDGISLRPLLLLPFVLAYMGLAYGSRGVLIAVLLLWIALLITAYLQSEDLLDAASRDTLFRDAVIGGLNLTLLAVLLGALAWNLQQALSRASRIAIQTRATAEAGQAILRTLNMDELLTRSVDLIRDRFALYHVQIFIVDEARAFANLAASTGEIGQGLMAQGFQVALNAHTIISDVIASRELIYIKDVAATTYQHPKLLAATRSEIAVPLLVGEEAFGVLDIHSLRPNAFSNEDIETMRVMANQLSQAIQNARLFEAQQRGLLQNRRLFLESETNLREIQRLNRQLTGQAWQDYVIERDQAQFSVQMNGQDMRVGAVEWTPPMRQAMTRHRLVIQKHDNDQLLAIPISIRGQPIGAIEVRLAGEHNQSEVLSVLQAVAERVAFSLENARLFEQSQAILEREQQINMITARLQGLTSVEDVLTVAISSLGQALHAEQGSIRLLGLDQVPSQSGESGHITQDQAL